MSVPFLDCRNEVSTYRNTPTARRAWLASDITPADWIVTVSPQMLDEIDVLARFIELNPVQNLQRRASDFALPICRSAIQKMKHILDQGVGFAVLDSLPMDDYAIDTLVEIYWLLGQLIGRQGKFVHVLPHPGTVFNKRYPVA